MADQPKAQQLSLADFIEVATVAALRAVDAYNKEVSLNPQPLPPGQAQVRRPGGPPVIIGIVAASTSIAE